MIKFSQRRLRNSLICALAIVSAWFIFDILELSLSIQQYYSGWLLTLLILSLLSFYLRKRLKTSSLGSSASWAQWHYYIGLFLAFCFLAHIEFSLPNGLVESSLALLLVTVMMTGVIGGVINRRFAKRLAALDEEVIFERIAHRRIAMKAYAEQVILEAVKASHSKTLSNYYIKHLASYFSKPRFLFAHIIGSHYAYIRLRQGLENQLRYFNREEVEAADQLFELMKKKNTLDIHSALQGVLKYWGMFHFPVALMMLLLLLLHIVLVYAFRGAA